MTPSDLYAQRLTERRDAAAALRRRELTYSFARVALIAATVVLLFVHAAFALIPFALFFVVAVAHDRLIRARKRLESGAAFYERGIARIDGTWPGRGDRGEEFTDDHHPYANDFDLFGRGSLFELISLALTRAGRLRLATWLKTPEMNVGEIHARQAAVQELRENVDLREDLATTSTEVVHEVESAKLDEWSAMAEAAFTPLERIVMLAVPGLSLVLIAIVIFNVRLWPLLLLGFAVSGIAVRSLQPRVDPIVSGVERAEPALALLGGILLRLERESFQSERLARLHARIGGAYLEIERLRKRVALLDARRNQFFAPIAILLLWTPNVAVAIERWRSLHGARILDWIDVVAECEALSSLSSFAFEHPSFAMPNVVEQGPLFDARTLGHPLIPGDRRVPNDLRLDGTRRLFIVSGSNMSGKSTMLRSTGIAAVLAMAGAPVCASSLTIAPMAVGASIRIHDSLQENASRFYAEILRIRQVLEMSQQGPLLFLLDEMLAGTNSHDRRIGAEAIVKALVANGAIGLVSTHDLALAEIGKDNVHFEDHLENGRVVFDYRMRPGVVTKSNALELMRSVGIDV